MKYAWVTGGAGFIGSHLVEFLVASGWHVTVVDDLTSGDLANIAHVFDRIRFIRSDFADQNVLDEIASLKTAPVVFHLAARPRVSYSVEHPAETNDVNVQKTVRLLEACKSGNIKRFVFSSSSSVYGGALVMPTPETYPRDPKSPYALQKAIIEDYCHLFSSLYNIDTVCLRYFNVFGPRAKGDGPYATAVSAWITAIKKSIPARSDGDGTQSRDMCYVENVVRANVLAAEADTAFGGDVFNIACQDSVTNREILDWLSARFEFAIINAPERAGDVKHTCADISRAKNILGYEPKVRFWEGLKMTLAAENMKYSEKVK